MKNQINQFVNKVELIDKFLFSFIAFIPLSLAISIFFADLLASISSLILIYIYFTKKNFLYFKSIRKELLFFIFFYMIIIVSLFASNYKSDAFLPSFFYFRYFFLALCIFYILKKYEFIYHLFYTSIFISIGIVLFDSFFQYFFGFNIFGYEKINFNENYQLSYLTSFFNDEKKLGSYMVRFLPLILSLIYFQKNKIPLKFELMIIFGIGSIVFFASERTALFLLFVIYIFYFLISNKKTYFLIIGLVVFTFLFSFNNHLKTKYINFTLKQIGISSYLNKDSDNDILEKKIVRYYSEEHENLTFTGIEIFKQNYLFGSGIKSFYLICNDLKKKNIIKLNKRKNVMTCSTHPHNTYIQILSEIGIFGFFLIVFVFLSIFIKNIFMLFRKVKSNSDRSYFFINLSIIINLMPFIPSGSFFNNWICLMMFFSLGFWLYIKDKLNT